MAEVIYICSEDHHNKFWSYEVDGTSVTVRWGRVGLDGQSKTEELGSAAAVQKFIDSKVREKTKKGYKLSSEEKLAEEEEKADELGTRKKIKLIQWVSRKGDELKFLDAYDPKQYIYVEVLHSWKKTVERFLFSKTSSWVIEGGVTEEDRTITVGSLRELVGSHPAVEVVRKTLRKMAEVVREALKTVKVGAIGKRNLFDDDTSEPTPEVSSVLAKISSPSMEAGVVRKIAAIGRVLEL
jgi:predicted DNA-binding WGR domain protein